MSLVDENLSFSLMLVHMCIDRGVRHFVVSPGARSTPLVLAVEHVITEFSIEIEVHRILDERSAGFFALGIGRALGVPAALICTSGTAGAHYYPAVIEASQSQVPLVVLTADRPPELQRCGAMQTVQQSQFFGCHVRDYVELSPIWLARNHGWVRTQIALVLDRTQTPQPGPVHVNIPFREPLWEPDVDIGTLGECANGPREGGPNIVRGRAAVPKAIVSSMAQVAVKCSHGVFVLGPGCVAGDEHVDALGYELGRLAKLLGWPVLAEPASCLRFSAHLDGIGVGYYDLMLRSESFAKCAPECVIRFGQFPTSQSLRNWLARSDGGCNFLVEPSGVWSDPSHRVETLVVADPVWLCGELFESVMCSGVVARQAWMGRWRMGQDVVQTALTRYPSSVMWEGDIVGRLLPRLPEGTAIHVANSMSIRDLDTFAPPTARLLGPVFCNRGVSGIDGTLSTALGESVAGSFRSMLVIAGDLSFLHDLSGLVVASRMQSCHTTVLVVDNDGGGIFHYLPIAQHSGVFEESFVTSQSMDLAAFAMAAGLRTRHVDDVDGLLEAVLDDLERPGVGVVVARVNRDVSVEQHREVFALVAEALSESLSNFQQPWLSPLLSDGAEHHS